jgi:hypothetical protein
VTSDLPCWALELGRQPLALCARHGLMRVYQLDLETGARTIEREVKVTQGVETSIGGTAYYPPALMIDATCDGRAAVGYCVRDATGTYRTFDAPPHGTKGTALVFPGEVIYTLPDATGALELRRAGTKDQRGAPLDTAQRVIFSADAMERVHATIQFDPTATSQSDAPIRLSGVVRLSSAVRMFHGPNPFAPAHASPMNHAVDLPLDGTGPRSFSVPGVIATAGLHALRLDRGKLYESADGWATWYEVAPPPTGVPTDLDGAMCDDRGCLFGGWARVGWDR